MAICLKLKPSEIQLEEKKPQERYDFRELYQILWKLDILIHLNEGFLH